MGRIRPLSLSTIQDPVTLVKAVIQRDRQRLDYCAEVAGEVALRAERASDLERKTRDALAQGLGLTWSRVIVLERARAPRPLAALRDGLRASAAVTLARGEVALREDGAHLFRGWKTRDLATDGPGTLGAVDSRRVSLLAPGLDSRLLVSAYTDSAWKAFLLWAERGARLAETLETSTSISEILQRIGSSGSGTLAQ